MSGLRWRMSRIDVVIDRFVSIILFVFVNFSTCYELYSTITEGSLISKSIIQEWLFILSIAIFEIFIWLLILSYRVVEIKESVELANVMGRNVSINTSEIESLKTKFKTFYRLKLKSGKKYVLFNHKGGAEKLFMMIKE